MYVCECGHYDSGWRPFAARFVGCDSVASEPSDFRDSPREGKSLLAFRENVYWRAQAQCTPYGVQYLLHILAMKKILNTNGLLSQEPAISASAVNMSES